MDCCISFVHILMIYLINHPQMTSMAYLLWVMLSVFIVDMYLILKPNGAGFYTKNPKSELQLILGCLTVNAVTLIFRFVLISDWDHLDPVVRLTFLPFVILFVHPVLFGAVFLLMKYKLKDPGFMLNTIVVAIPIICCAAVVSIALVPEKILWPQAY